MRRAAAVLLLLAATLPLAASENRPDTWAVPVSAGRLENCYQVSPELFRGAQPRADDVEELRRLGIRTVLNLRKYHSGPEELKSAGLNVISLPLEADDLTVEDLAAALRRIKHAPKPVLVHCWHGSDRTGSVVAAYRIVFQGWTSGQALDELRRGGYGHHENWFPNIRRLFNTLDTNDLRHRVQQGEPEPEADRPLARPNARQDRTVHLIRVHK
jgi:tyrosine-protein phosphatase SIW14